MCSGHVAILGLAATLALIPPGCGGDETATGAATGTTDGKAAIESRSGAAPPGVRGEATAGGGADAKRPTASARCRRTLGEFLDAMESLANSLAVGLDYERYLGAVSGVRETYASVDAESLDLVCLGRVAGPAEASLNLYIDAANEWGECLAESACKTTSIEAKLQRRWEEADDRLGEASDGLRRLG